MSDCESIKKMLRAVLQSSKNGVSINTLQSEYRSLCGENIPLKKLGFSKLEDYLRSIPSVVRLQYHMGELKCFAAVCKETAHIAELVAKQRSSKKSGRSQVVTSKMRFRPSNPYMLNVTPRSSLRQPSSGSLSNWTANRFRPHSGYRSGSASGDYRRLDQRLSSITPVEHRQPVVKQSVMLDRGEMSFVNAVNKNSREILPEPVSRPRKSQTDLYNVAEVQSQITQVLEKYSNGLWVSKLSDVYRQTFNQTLHPQVLIDLENWPTVCMVEKPSITNRADRLIYPPLPPKPSTISLNSTNSSTVSLLDSTDRAAADSVSSSVTLQHPAHKQGLPLRLPQCTDLAININNGCKNNHNLAANTCNRNTFPLAPTWTNLPSANGSDSPPSLQPDREILPFMKVTHSSSSSAAACPPSDSSAVVLPVEICHRIKELLSKYSHGLWTHALPKLFMDTYKMAFPEHILDNLAILQSICTIEYPFPHNKKKAILYDSRQVDMELRASHESQPCRLTPLPSGLEVLGPKVPPRLTLPSEQYSSVLVTDAKSSNAVTIRYVGDKYSAAQEAMEDAMHSFYSQNSAQHLLSNPIVGQLVAVKGEDGDEVTRAQILEVISPNKFKLYCVDHGVCLETDGSNLLELHQDFLSLPFQATNVRLAGLEVFSSHPSVLSCLDQLAVSKILLMETVEPCQLNEMPLVVLYDTSQDNDININSRCLKSLQDKSMNNPLSENVIYQDVCVSDVSADGTMYCQLPSRGTARLTKFLEETEAYFISQTTSEFLVSRPFYGKFCLARYKGKWARAEITSMCGNRVIEILFIDLGVSATVEVTDLREIPPLFLRDFTMIPPQVIKCRLADLSVPDREWSHEAILWLKELVLGAEDCKMKILKQEKYNEDKVVLIYLFVGGDGQELHKSINHQLAQSEVWQRLIAQNNNTITSTGSNFKDTGRSSPFPNPIIKTINQPSHQADIDVTKSGLQPLPLPPPLTLPQPGQNMDVFVPVACHPGYFVLQPWQDLNKLAVLMGEMVFYYNQPGNTTNTTLHIQKGEIYAAKIEKNWHRVQVKGILANGLVSIYELDYGKHELVRNTHFQPLIEEFRQLPFQAIATQLAGVTQQQWSEEAALVFRNHVEKRALVAQVDSLQDVSEVKSHLWKCRLRVYLVDTSVNYKDFWIHSIMADIGHVRHDAVSQSTVEN
ncbi:tudor domain-containing protein 7A isoform X2 [Melanotaenia boesemani]|uniref:tudor domain-containing protein 7A isoform X2 n=1 Tax=Melanotaenia boesemani TaxID=1250792 RepID=UPI001C0415ED|nr:tudor domain-containing protein 7A isoform X2 [Melanotaenia boesemani]